MLRSPSRIDVFACVALILATATAGCSEEQAAPQDTVAGGPYRHRLINQLDLPKTKFDGWEVVDAVGRPDPMAGFSGTRDFDPPACAPDSPLVRQAVDDGGQWTGAIGTGPGGRRFEVSISAGGTTDLFKSVPSYLAACQTFRYRDAQGTPMTATVMPTTPATGTFAEVSGFRTVAAGHTTSTMIGQASSLIVVLRYVDIGEGDDSTATTLWQLVTSKFERTS